MGGNRWDTSSLIKRFRKIVSVNQLSYYENFKEIEKNLESFSKSCKRQKLRI